MGDLGGEEDDVKFNNAAANSLILTCETAALLVQSQVGPRANWVATGLNEFDGYFSELFRSNGRVQSSDATLLITRLREVAQGAGRMKEEAAKEQTRREVAREWKHKHDNRNLGDRIHDAVFGEDKPPVGPPAEKVVINVAAPTIADRETPQPGSGGGSSGRSSARPDDLRTFATNSSGANEMLRAWPGKLRTAYDEFTAKCDFGTLEASGVWPGFERYLESNDHDVAWANTVADAFEAAGGSGNVSTLSDAAIMAALNTAGVAASRTALEMDPPTAFGLPTTTGYSDDPVNTLTGNFLENEADLGFAGGCATLAFTRTYNSRNPEMGAFGIGWSSWAEAGLQLRDDQARWLQADGRQVVFPRLGDGWDRATGENFWLVAIGDHLVIRDNAGGRWKFSRSGRLEEFDRGAGTQVALDWVDGRLTSLAHERGRSIEVEWSGSRIVAVRASDGRRVSYDYDDAGRLLRASGPQGARSYRWNEAGLIEAVTDADGVVEASNRYEEVGRVVAQTSAFGRTSRYAYLAGGATVVSDADGTRSNTWLPDAKGRLAAVIDANDQRQSMAYDRWGNLVSVTERDGSTTLTEYDVRGRRVRRVTASGADLQWGYDDLDRVTTVVTEAGAVSSCHYVGDSLNPSELVDPSGGITTMEWAKGLLVRVSDPSGVVVRFTYDEHGDLIATSDAEGNTAKLERDHAGRVIAAVTPLGHRTTFSYSPNGTLDSRRNPDGGVWRYTYSNGGRLTSITDPLGARTEVEYGAHGEESRTIDPLGRAVTRSFDDLGNLAAAELPDGSKWQFAHDALSRLVETTDPMGGKWRSQFDVNGLIAGRTDPTGVQQGVQHDPVSNTISANDGLVCDQVRFDPLGRPLGTTDVSGASVMASYDPCGRPVEVLDADGNLTRIERDPAGRVVTLTSPSGMTTRYGWDSCGRLSTITDPGGAVTKRTYDADGRLVGVTAPTGEMSRYSYDSVGRLVAVFEPGRGTARHTYDLAGRVVRSYDTWHGHRRFSYDPAGQLVEVFNGNGGTTRYTYDELGRVVTITNPDGGVTQRTWDAANHLVAETDPLGRISQAGYDAAGRQLWQTDPDGHRTEWSFDSSGRPAALSVDGRQVSAISRDLKGRRVRIVDNTDPERESVQSLEWDRRGNLVRHVGEQGTTAWSYDVEGRRTSMTDVHGGVTDYSWDAAGRLAGVEHPRLGRASFSYDPSGRLVRAAAGRSIHSWRYSNGWLAEHTTTGDDGSGCARVERDSEGRIYLAEVDGAATSYRYDEAGQLIAAGKFRWVYDTCGRLVTESIDGLTCTHRYDLAGQLLATEGPQGITSYRYDEAGRRTREDRPDGSWRAFEWSPAGRLAGISSHQGDRVQQTRVRVDAEGRLSSVGHTRITWDVARPVPAPTGVGDTPILTAGPLTGVGSDWSAPGWRTGRATAATDPWTSPGAAFLAPSVAITGTGGLLIDGLEWLGARAYDPASRSFLSVDPLPPTAGAGWAGNPYSYAGNNPLGLLDPAGLHPVTDAELQAYADAHGGALAAARDWVVENGEYLIGGAMVIAGGVLIATGAGGPAGLILISAGADTIIQRATTGEVDWGQVVISGAAGGFGGGGAAAKLGLAGFKHTVAAGVISSGAGGAASGAYDYLSGPGPHTVKGFAAATATRAGLDALTGGAGAAASHGLVSGINALGRTKTGPDDLALYRGDTRHPDEIFETGFQPRGTSTNLTDHAAGEPSAFVSTSKSRSMALDFTAKPPTRSGWVYEVHVPQSADTVDVNKTLGLRSPFRPEREIAVAGGIPTEQIARARQASWRNWQGDWVDNPNFQG